MFGIGSVCVSFYNTTNCRAASPTIETSTSRWIGQVVRVFTAGANLPKNHRNPLLNSSIWLFFLGSKEVAHLFREVLMIVLDLLCFLYTFLEIPSFLRFFLELRLHVFSLNFRITGIE